MLSPFHLSHLPQLSLSLSLRSPGPHKVVVGDDGVVKLAEPSLPQLLARYQRDRSPGGCDAFFG
eukprot:755298-Hanusia_phi.AAC.1